MRHLCLLASMLLLSSPTIADNMTVAVERIDYSPFYKGKGRAFNGFARELLDNFAKDNGHNLTYAPMKIVDLWQSFLEGQNDLKFPDNPAWNKNGKKGKNVYYSNVIFETKVGVVVKSKDANKQLRAVGVVEGFTPWIILDKIKDNSITLIKSSSMTKLSEQLKSGKIDGIYGSLDVINFYSKNNGMSVTLSKTVASGVDKFHLSSIKGATAINQFNTWFEKNQKMITKMRQKYFK